MFRLRVALTKLKCTSREGRRVHFTLLRIDLYFEINVFQKLSWKCQVINFIILIYQIQLADSSICIRDANLKKVKMHLNLPIAPSLRTLTCITSRARSTQPLNHYAVSTRVFLYFLHSARWINFT